MSDNVLQTLQKLVQDVIAPDVRELKVRLESHSHETETRFTSLEKQLASMERNLISAIGELKAQTELNTLSAVYELRERIAVLESKAA